MQILFHKSKIFYFYRYMTLIDGANYVYMIDRDNAVFHIPNLEFPRRKQPDEHICNTLVDGVSLN